MLHFVRAYTSSPGTQQQSIGIAGAVYLLVLDLNHIDMKELPSMKQWIRQATLVCALGLMLVLALVLSGLLPSGTSGGTVRAAELMVIGPSPEPTPPAPVGPRGDARRPFVVVGYMPSPSLTVQAGSVIDLVLSIRNLGFVKSNNTTITLPYNPAVLTVLSAEFLKNGTYDRPAFVRVNDPGVLIIETGDLANRTTMTATIRVVVNATVAPGTALTERLIIAGHGVNRERSRSNQPLLVVGATSAHAPIYDLPATPLSGPAGSTHVFTSSVFHPYEPVTFWYRALDGTDIELDVFEADEEGRIEVAYTTTGLPPGRYTLSANGNWSMIQAAGVFVVE